MNQNQGSNALNSAAPMKSLLVLGQRFLLTKPEAVFLRDCLARMVDQFDKDEVSAKLNAAKRVPGTRVYVERPTFAKGERMYGIVADPGVVKAVRPTSPFVNDPNKVWAYWDGNTKPTWITLDEVKVAE